MKKVILLPLAVYLPALFIFFSGDDWFHLRVSNINKLSEFLSFFSFEKTAQSIAFYRPLPTQVFFFVFQKLFGLNPLPYHIFVLACFGLAGYLFYRLAKKLLGSEKKAIISTLIFGFASSNVTRVYFLSHFQEIALVVFSLQTVLSYLENKKLQTVIFFVLAIMSKETAVILPLVILIIDWSRKKLNLKKLIPYALVLIPYLYLRLGKFGGAVGETYGWNFSPIKMVNTFMWYGLWSVGAPELLLDYIGSGFRPIGRFFTDFPVWWPLITWPLLANLAFLFFLFIRKIKSIDRKFVFFMASFVVSLLPVLFLPQHKFAVELGLPLVWFSLTVAWLLPENKKTIILFVLVFLSLNIPMNILTAQTHYSVGRAKVSKKVYDFVIKDYPNKPNNVYFEFINDTRAYTPEWGSSRQISNSIQGSEMFRFIYNDPNYLVYFEDFPGIRPANEKKVSLSTKMFVQ